VRFDVGRCLRCATAASRVIGKIIHTFEQLQQALAQDVAAIDAGPRPTMSTHKAGNCLLHFEPNPVLATDLGVFLAFGPEALIKIQCRSPCAFRDHEVAIEREPARRQDS
jgi:hypothetical protein